MTSLDPNFKDLLECLNSAGVRYLVLGGYAVNFHGYRRNTKDFDVWIALDPDNAERVSVAMQRFGFSRASVPPEKFLTKGHILAFGREPLRVDIITDPSGVDFAICYEHRVEAMIEGVRIPFIALEDLKANKRSSGRLKDLADLENLPPSGGPIRSKNTPRRKRHK
jgi:hypothetical protein